MRFKKRFDDMPDDASNPAIHRIFITILGYALWDGVREIRITPLSGFEHGTGKVTVFYKIGGEWNDQIRAPLYIHKPLLERIRTLIDANNEIRIKLLEEKMKFQFSFIIVVSFNPTEHGDEVLLQLKKDDTDFFMDSA